MKHNGLELLRQKQEWTDPIAVFTKCHFSIEIFLVKIVKQKQLLIKLYQRKLLQQIDYSIKWEGHSSQIQQGHGMDFLKSSSHF